MTRNYVTRNGQRYWRRRFDVVKDARTVAGVLCFGVVFTLTLLAILGVGA